MAQRIKTAVPAPKACLLAPFVGAVVWVLILVVREPAAFQNLTVLMLGSAALFYPLTLVGGIPAWFLIGKRMRAPLPFVLTGAAMGLCGVLLLAWFVPAGSSSFWQNLQSHFFQVPATMAAGASSGLAFWWLAYKEIK